MSGRLSAFPDPIFAVGLGAARRDVPMRDAKVSEVPGKVGAELVAVAGLNPLAGHEGQGGNADHDSGQ
jgi:hypothetical protein